VGKMLGTPLYRYFGLDPRDTPVTTFSIGIDTPEMTRQKTREAADFPVLKIKVGLATDEPTIEAVRSVTKKPLRVDANEGWTDKEEAVRKINWLEKQGVEFVEQPMPAAMMGGSQTTHLPERGRAVADAHRITPRLGNHTSSVTMQPAYLPNCLRRSLIWVSSVLSSPKKS
jgi:L-alanine-DL-glutamate epimerase-like enolase superfamily enzyme